MRLNHPARYILSIAVVFIVCFATLGVVIFTRPSPTPLGEGFFFSNLERDNSPNVSQDDSAALVNGNSAFALDLYQKIRNADNNLFFSPYSISLALAMTYAGAKGDTAQQMADALSFTLPQEQLHPAFNALDLALISQCYENFKFNIANSLWGQTGFNFNSEFLDTLALNYGAGMRLLNFQQDPEAARVKINDWVSEQTENKINDLIPSGDINTSTALVLTNAIYFKALWEHAFLEDLTKDDTFTLLNGTQVTVPMMSGSGEVIRYAEGDGYQAVELPYKDTSMSMLILLPALDRFEEFESTLTAEHMNGIVGNLGDQYVIVNMPKFRFEASMGLANTLAEMGMPLAFTDQADFSGITPDRSLCISQVLHKAFISVDENGTEAAAATAVVMVTTGFYPQPITVSIDHPFIFLIRDTNTGAILFLGRVLDPRS